jgi:hypothetical protein
MRTRTRPGSDDEGETLVELIISVAIMGITVIALVGGIATSILMSDIHRKQATAGASVRSYAEAVAGHFDASAATSGYSPAAVGFAVPEGFTAAVTPPVKCWNDTLKVFGGCAAGSAVQQVTLSVASSDSRASESLAVVVRKP